VGITFDASGNLWVADAANNRVVRFPAASTTGAAATIALGQPNLTSNAANNGGLSASSLSNPNAVIVDNSGNVWVADTGNNRVLEFRAPLATGMAASVALGQPDFVSNGTNQGLGAPTSATLSAPAGLQVTDANALLVGDTGNNRSVVFTSFATGVNATTVLGQTNFTSNAANQGGAASAATQSEPWGAGPSLIALLVLGALVLGWFVYQRRRQGRISAA